MNKVYFIYLFHKLTLTGQEQQDKEIEITEAETVKIMTFQKNTRLWRYTLSLRSKELISRASTHDLGTKLIPN